MPESHIRVLLALSNQVQADALKVALSSSFDCEILTVGSERSQVVRAFQEYSPNVIVVSSEGEGALSLVEAAAPRAPVLVLSSAHGRPGPDEMIAAVEAGALGYVSARASFEEIGLAVMSVASGRATVPPLMLADLLRHVINRHRATAAMSRRLDVLTKREGEVFRLLATGMDKIDIAEALFISPETARTHIQRIMNKLGVRSRSDLVALAAQAGMEVGTDVIWEV